MVYPYHKSEEPVLREVRKITDEVTLYFLEKANCLVSGTEDDKTLILYPAGTEWSRQWDRHGKIVDKITFNPSRQYCLEEFDKETGEYRLIMFEIVLIVMRAELNRIRPLV